MPTRDHAIRIIIIRTVLLGRRILTQRGKEADETPEQALCTMAIRLGQYEGRPMSIRDIANATAIPYATVDRYLKTLKKKGYIRSERVGRRVVHFLPMNTETKASTMFYKEFDRLLSHACVQLNALNDERKSRNPPRSQNG